MTALIQNFSVPAGNDIAVPLNVPTNMVVDGDVYWRVYQQAFGVPDYEPLESPPSPSLAPLIEKSSLDGSITLAPLQVQIQRQDTVEMLRNYYHETTMVDEVGNVSTINCGIMTVTETLYQ